MELQLRLNQRVIVKEKMERKKLDIHPISDASCYMSTLITSTPIFDVVTIPQPKQATVHQQFIHSSLKGLFKWSLYAIGFLTWFISAWYQI